MLHNIRRRVDRWVIQLDARIALRIRSATQFVDDIGVALTIVRR